MAWFATLFSMLCGVFQSRASLQIENLALKHQLAVLQRTSRRPLFRSRTTPRMHFGPAKHGRPRFSAAHPPDWSSPSPPTSWSWPD